VLLLLLIMISWLDGVVGSKLSTKLNHILIMKSTYSDTS